MANFDGKTRRASRGTALYVTLAAAFMLIAVIVAMALFFTISEITVQGASRYSAGEVIRASGVEADNSIFFLNTASAEIAVKDALPYVDSVKVSRHLPGTVTITVTESVPVAYFTSGGAYYIVDLNGRILEETTASGVGKALELRGITAEDPKVGKALSLGSSESVRLRSLKEVLSALNENGRLELTTWLDVTNLASITFECNGYRVNIGETSDLAVKFRLLSQFFNDHPDTGYGQSVYYDKDERGLRYEP